MGVNHYMDLLKADEVSEKRGAFYGCKPFEVETGRQCCGIRILISGIAGTKVKGCNSTSGTG